MKILIANDHAGFELKQKLIAKLSVKYEFEDLGAYSEESVDYPDYAKKLCQKLTDKEADFGVLICGSGVGISIAANRYPKVRAALVYNEEIAKLARMHNDANVICLGARFLNEDMALNLIETFISTQFEGGRHSKRVEKLSC
jgi:ribose 5-phosphate isomerase B